MSMFQAYYHLTKPGIVYGNSLTAAAGLLFAFRGNFDAAIFFGTTIGLALIIAAACVVNNFLDRDIDALMARTKHRALAADLIKPNHALNFGAVLLGVGVALLYVLSSPLALMVALFGFFIYVFVYTFLKRVTFYATHFGAVAGAVPPVVGYTAVTGSFDFFALLLFLILCFWQMSHFFAIALFRRFEYAAAGVPVLPLMRGVYRTKVEIVFYTLAFSFAGVVLMLATDANTLSRFILGSAAAAWSGYAVSGYIAQDTTTWARTVFLLSLIALLALSLSISIV